MPTGLPRRRPLAMRLWLARRLRRSGPSAASAATTERGSSKPMSIESLEHLVRGRIRMLLRHTWLVTCLGTVVIAGGVGSAIYMTAAPTEVRVAAGPPDSIAAKFAQILARKLADDHSPVRLQLVSTSGAQDSAQAMSKKAADLAILPSTVVDSQNWPAIAILRQNVMALIVPAPAASPAAAGSESSPAIKKPVSPAERKGKTAKRAKPAHDAKVGKADKVASAGKNAKSAEDDSPDDDSDAAGGGKREDNADAAGKLESVSQLAGKRIGVVTDDAAATELLDVVLRHYGVAAEKIDMVPIASEGLADAVKAGRVDVIFVAGSATGRMVSAAVTAATQNGRAPRFIAIDQADGIAKRNPAFDSVDIDAGTFGGNPPSPDDSLKSLGFADYVVARRSFKRDTVTELAKLIYSARLALAAEMPGEIHIKAPSTDKDAGVAVHPGALAYLGDDQKSFFDKYGDEIFYGLLIFPILGSAIAGVAGYFRHSGRTRRLRLLQRLLDLVREAHAAPSLAALEEMQADVDGLVVAIIHQSEREEFDQTAQTSFALALDQVRFAIAARRAALRDHAGGDGQAGASAAAA
jgi:TRAP-type uncharacterized transport system substrate-binding protein